VRARVEVRRRGFYPEGGGEVHLSVAPAGTLGPIEWLEGPRVPPIIRSLAARLPRSVADRQLRAAESYLQAHQIECAGREVAVEEAASPGTAIGVFAVGPERSFLGADALGERGVPAEHIGQSTAERFVREAQAGVPVDHHLADMLVTLLPFAVSESRFRTSTASAHLETNLYVAAQLTGCRYAVEQLPGGATEVRVVPARDQTRNA
ncbi:MAG: RNA 3'-terminal phosphate cyclase, partial [bacterium]